MTYHKEQLAKAAKIDARLHDILQRNGTFLNQPTIILRNMVLALSLHAWRNTPGENTRLADAKYFLANRHKLNRVAS